MTLFDKIKTAEVLAWKGIYIDNPKCYFCQDNLESNRHLFFECHYSYKTLIRLIPTLQNFLLRPNVSQALDFIEGLPGENKNKSYSLLLFNATVYHLWRERNNQRFNSSAKCFTTLASEIAKEVRIKSLKWKWK
ncbi:hypothetical protein MA16_Dca017181 [Dendrobium catenatum]|uniref:Reverse transcriptase zinc-binding domain-containing protein n=1 Tax=Dendrobium catenatum TaxID=906689 RepID=A0A2I0XAT5_9ASPA|nr:hypothetical protein MA16_Dca017181 [Dendrobium catenatum]